MKHTSDHYFIDRALTLAQSGTEVFPNPFVGCVIAKNGKMIATGYHGENRQEHAEIIALAKAGNRARGATLYCTIEPCVMFPGKKTGSCTQAIVDAGIRRVVMSLRDPFPPVHNRGIASLRRQGVAVQNGVGGKKARILNTRFFAYAKRYRDTKTLPFVYISSAMTLDGKLSTDRRVEVPIAGGKDEVRKYADAIVVGGTTFLHDDPSLTLRSLSAIRFRTRSGREPQPMKVAIIHKLAKRVSLNNDFFKGDAPKIIFTTSQTSAPLRDYYARKAVVVMLGSHTVPLRKALHIVWQFGANRVMVEGGGETNYGFLREGVVQEIWVRIAAKVFGGRTAPTLVDGKGFSPHTFPVLSLRSVKTVKDGIFVRYRIQSSHANSHSSHSS